MVGFDSKQELYNLLHKNYTIQEIVASDFVDLAYRITCQNISVDIEIVLDKNKFNDLFKSEKFKQSNLCHKYTAIVYDRHNCIVLLLVNDQYADIFDNVLEAIHSVLHVIGSQLKPHEIIEILK